VRVVAYACVRVRAPMHSLVPSVSCPSAENVLARSYLFFFCLSMSLLLHVRLYADLMSICVCAGVFSKHFWCVCVYIQQRSTQGSNLVGGQACCETLRFSDIMRCRRAGVYARALSLFLSERVWVLVSVPLSVYLSVCLSVSTLWFVFLLCTLHMFPREVT
jgi:hypothetical protein